MCQSKVVEEGMVWGLLQGFNPHKSVDPDGIHPKVLREVVDTISRPLPIIFQKSWRSGGNPDDWKKANVISV